ncbi:MAG TPA: LysR substrate-binding domain-containing protein, partial [Azospirillum sp.]|nr:LysR substrate-binding domain-containing protein [Azospirillum sp.]
ADFTARYPAITLRIVTSNDLADFTRDGIDAGVRYGRGQWPQTYAERLAPEELFPVCAPALLSSRHPLRCPDDLRHHMLLHGELVPGWADWLDAAGVHGVDVGKGPRFTDAISMLEAACAGHGVALARSVLVRDDLASGRLVRPFETAIDATKGYYFVCAPNGLDHPGVVAFRDWLMDVIGT